MRHNNYRLTRERCKIFSLELLTEVDGDQSASEQAHHAAETTKTCAPPTARDVSGVSKPMTCLNFRWERWTIVDKHAEFNDS